MTPFVQRKVRSMSKTGSAPEGNAALLHRPTTRRKFAVLAVAGVLGLGMGPAVARRDDKKDDDSHPDDSTGRDDRVQPSGRVPAGSTEVVIDDDDANGFQPGTITIDAGQSVTWVNQDKHPHTATGAEFDTGVMQPGESATVTFDTPGSFPYSCTIHPVMTGVVEVRDASGRVPSVTAASPEASPVASPQATPASTSGSVIDVAIDKLAFSPADLEVPAGATVRWTNREAIPHTVRSTDKRFDSGILNQNDTFEYTFNDPGTFDYICALHPSMKGSVRVTA